MTTFPEFYDRLASWQEHFDSYRYSGNELTDKTLVTLIAPTAVGKSTVIQHILDCAAAEKVDAGEVGTWTTRDGREDDPANYRTGIGHDKMFGHMMRGELVNWAPHPSGNVYASAAESYPSCYNFLPTLPDALPMLRRAGFHVLRVFYLTTSVDAWSRQLDERRDDPAYKNRLLEGQQSLTWAKAHQSEITVLENRPGEASLQELARRVLDTKQYIHSIRPSGTRAA